MFCPQCGTDMPDDAQFCPTCGRDMTAGASADAQPTAPMPVLAPPKKKRGLLIAVVIIVVLLLLCCGGVAAALLIPAIRDRMPWAKPSVVTSQPTPATPSAAANDADIQAATKVIDAYYAGINAGDLEAVKALVTEDTKAGVDPGAYEGWSKTTFEYTRGWIDGDTAFIIGRENPQAAFGSGDNGGGVKFTLIKTAGAWLIDTWNGVDAAQVEGSSTAGSSGGLPGSLTEANATELIRQLLEARKIGAANIIRRLASERFLKENGDVWLDGFNNSEYFSFRITSAKVTGTTATVLVSETWPDGETPTAYGIIEKSGAILVDSWQP
jgi:hypothetical protein